jgi:hypothetical protein
MYGCESWSATLREEHRLRVFENRMGRRIFGPKGLEVAGGWRRLHSEESHNLYASQNIIRVLKSGRIRWVGYVACMQMRIAWSENLKGRDHLEDLGIDGRIILDWILEK